MNTESVNQDSLRISEVSTPEVLKMINNEDKKVAAIVEECIPQISKLVEAGRETVLNNGRIFYIGAGTSGRISVADAAELPPTYGLSPETVTAIIAGGAKAVVRASEGCEDSIERSNIAFDESGIKKGDMAIGISASGNAPFVVNFLQRAKEIGCVTGCVTNNENTKLEKIADIAIVALTGAEVIKGSTRMKGGLSQKMILNMFSTALCVRLGYVYGNMMVNMKVSNSKLERRAVMMVCEITGMDETEAEKKLKENDWSVYDTVKNYTMK